jgi:integrase
VITISLRPVGRYWGTISFASTLYLCPILDLLLTDIPAKLQSELRLGLQEALVNAAKHGNNLDPGKLVVVLFSLLDNQYFLGINGDDFSRLSEVQYRKFQSVRCYYNKLLKLVAVQANINKILTSHLSRHSYASLMMDIGENVNLYDLMTSLGHRHLSTTQIYIQRMSNTKIDKLNLVISDKLNSSVSINL